MEIEFRAALWLYEGASGEGGNWHFLTLPRDIASQIQAEAGSRQKNFGTLRVTARVGRTRWKTSLFRDSKKESYLLPVKAEVRNKEQLRAGDLVDVLLVID